MSQRFDPITGDVIPVFFHYAIPSVIGMLAATSAGVIDGIFIGNFVGAPALAAVNISMPAFYLFAAVVFMLAVGGSVLASIALVTYAIANITLDWLFITRLGGDFIFPYRPCGEFAVYPGAGNAGFHLPARGRK